MAGRTTGPEAGGRTSMGARAREEVRQRIVDRRYPMGSRLVEREVAEELAMSRVPVREALRALVAEGLLELLPHSGVRVRSLERADVRYLYEVWEPLAVQASRLAARRRSEFKAGDPADFVLLRGEGTPQVVVDMPRRDMVVHGGHVVAADGELM